MTGESGQDPRRALAALFDGVSETALRVAYIEAIRAWQAESPTEDTIVLHGIVGQRLIETLRRADGERTRHAQIDVGWLRKSLTQPELFKLSDCNWWLVRTGIAVPVDYFDQAPSQMRLTGVGKRVMASWPDHPLADGFLDRLQARCPRLPESILMLFADARACLDHGLARPALVLLGAAYEEAVLSVTIRLATERRLGRSDEDSVERLKPWERIDRLRSTLEAVPQRARDHAGIAACRFADELRNRRNDAAHTHPTHPFDDAGEIQEFFISAGRHLPALWNVS